MTDYSPVRKTSDPPGWLIPESFMFLLPPGPLLLCMTQMCLFGVSEALHS